MSYAEFLRAKTRVVGDLGESCKPDDVHPMLHDWQREIVAWAVRRGRAALFEDCGLGKTLQQVEWARLSADAALVIAPLAVTEQTVREAAKVGVPARYVRDDAEVDGPGLWITNYEMAPHLDATRFGAVVLDESSILKNVDGKTRAALTAQFSVVPRRLACTATPAPNDVAELTNHAEFLGVATRAETLASYFIHDSDGWRLKGHASDAMWRWVASWAVAMRFPSDLGYSDDGYRLPGLSVVPHMVEVPTLVPEGQLFATDLGGVGGRAQVRRHSLSARVDRAVGLTRDGNQWIAWCGLNAESDAISAAVPDSVNVEGSWSPEDKSRALLDFADGRIRVLVTKPSIAGFGMNFQNCARMVFVGLSDSYESYYQAIRRCYRFGQTREVEAHIVLSELEAGIASNVARKEREVAAGMTSLVRHVRAGQLQLRETVA